VATAHVIAEVPGIPERLMLAVGVRAFIPFPSRCSFWLPLEWTLWCAPRISRRNGRCDCCSTALCSSGTGDYQDRACLLRPIEVLTKMVNTHRSGILPRRPGRRMGWIPLRNSRHDDADKVSLQVRKLAEISKLVDQDPKVIRKPSII
jgi:hypothetical protein